MRALFLILTAFLPVAACGQYKLWFYDGNICQVDTFSIDTSQSCIVYKNGKRFTYAYFDEVYAITCDTDTTLFYEPVDMQKTFAYIQGVHDGLGKFNYKVFFISSLIAI